MDRESQQSCSHRVHQKAPQPKFPDASNQTSKSGSPTQSWRRMEVPFHTARNVDHNSTLAFALTHTEKCGLRRLYNCRTKFLLGRATCDTCWRRPPRDSKSLCLPDHLLHHSASTPFSRSSFSRGSHNSMAKVSISMPSTVRQLAKPSILSSATNTPVSEQVFMSSSRSLLHLSEPGGPVMTTSST